MLKFTFDTTTPSTPIHEQHRGHRHSGGLKFGVLLCRVLLVPSAICISTVLFTASSGLLFFKLYIRFCVISSPPRHFVSRPALLTNPPFVFSKMPLQEQDESHAPRTVHEPELPPSSLHDTVYYSSILLLCLFPSLLTFLH